MPKGRRNTGPGIPNDRHFISSLDTRGLVVGLSDAKDRLPPQGQLEAYTQSGYSAVMDFQDGLNALASDTGGRFLKNTNALDTAISTAMAEASRYYLLGWYVDANRLIPGKYWSLHVSIRDRPDLKVRLRAGQVDLSQSVPISRTKPIKPAVSPKEAADQLLRALQEPFPIDDLPVFVHAGWILDPDQGPIIALTYQVDADAIQGAGPASVEVTSGVADKDGRVVDKFTETLSRPPGASSKPPSDRVIFKICHEKSSSSKNLATTAWTWTWIILLDVRICKRDTMNRPIRFFGIHLHVQI